MNTNFFEWTRIFICCLAGVSMIGLAGCQGAGGDAAATEAGCGANAAFMDRGWEEHSVSFENGAVGHPVLYMDGYFEQYSKEDRDFVMWDEDDLWSLGGSPAEFLGEVVVWPVSAVLDRPWESEFDRDKIETQEMTDCFEYVPMWDEGDETMTENISEPMN